MGTAQPEGWYVDPADAEQYRYWTGTQWTTHVRSRREVEQTSVDARPLPDFDTGPEPSPEPTPAPAAPRSPRRTVFLAAAALLALISTAGIVRAGGSEPDIPPLTGTLRVAAERVRGLDGTATFLGDGATCGAGRSRGIGEGTEVTVTNGRGRPLATVALGAGRVDRTLTSTTCVFDYEVTGLRPARTYVVEVKGRPAARATRAELESGGWRLDARLG